MKKAESSSSQQSHGFLAQAGKNPKIVGMSPTVEKGSTSYNGPSCVAQHNVSDWFQLNFLSVGNMRWFATSLILPIWKYEKKLHWPLIGSRTVRTIEATSTTQSQDSNLRAQNNNCSLKEIHRQLQKIFPVYRRMYTSSAVCQLKTSSVKSLTSLRPTINDALTPVQQNILCIAFSDLSRTSYK